MLVQDPAEYFKNLGGLHDSEVERIVWAKDGGTLSLEVADIYSNFKGLPEYRGALSGTITFYGVSSISIESGHFRGRVKISGLDVLKILPRSLEVRLGLAEPGADIRIVCQQIDLSPEPS